MPDLAAVELVRHAGRYRRIAEVVAAHGLGALTDRLGVVTRHLRPGHDASAGSTDPAIDALHLRLALAELGPVFIKLGQMLSTRPDLLPPAFITELARLQSSAPALPSGVAEAVIEDELGESPLTLFADFDSSPLASASIGQAHAATLHDGTRVVVKVRRPEAAAQVHEDLDILLNLATEAERRSTLAENHDLVAIVTGFADTLRAELDYLTEGGNAERFARDLTADTRIDIPRVFWATTTSRVLTLERVGGTKVDDVAALDRAGIDRPRVVRDAVDAVAQMVFVHGFFHADPHPGNLFVQPSGRIALIDFGMVGEIDDELRDRCVQLFLALARKEVAGIATALLRMTAGRARIDRAALEHDLVPLVATYAGKQLAEVETGSIVTELLGILRRHRLQLPSTVILLLRMILMIDGMGRTLDPEFQLGTAVRPYIVRLAADRTTPAAWLRRAARARVDLRDLTANVPDRVRRVAERIETDGIPVALNTRDLDPLVARLERIGDRLVGGMIAAALITGIGELTAAGATSSGRWTRPLLHAGAGGVGALGAFLALTAHRRSSREP